MPHENLRNVNSESKLNVVQIFADANTLCEQYTNA